jgi:hypothetical protein
VKSLNEQIQMMGILKGMKVCKQRDGKASPARKKLLSSLRLDDLIVQLASPPKKNELPTSTPQRLCPVHDTYTGSFSTVPVRGPTRTASSSDEASSIEPNEIAPAQEAALRNGAFEGVPITSIEWASVVHGVSLILGGPLKWTFDRLRLPLSADVDGFL